MCASWAFEGNHLPGKYKSSHHFVWMYILVNKIRVSTSEASAVFIHKKTSSKAKALPCHEVHKYAKFPSDSSFQIEFHHTLIFQPKISISIFVYLIVGKTSWTDNVTLQSGFEFIFARIEINIANVSGPKIRTTHPVFRKLPYAEGDWSVDRYLVKFKT